MSTFEQLAIVHSRIRALCIALEKEWGHRPFVQLACADGSDEHWQIFHWCYTMPTFCVLLDGTVERHPDGVESSIDLETFFIQE